jgi:hypothetical protein
MDVTIRNTRSLTLYTEQQEKKGACVTMYEYRRSQGGVVWIKQELGD